MASQCGNLPVSPSAARPLPLPQAENTYLLTLDGDIDFKAESVTLLVDRMKKNKKVGAACGRIHPIGTGEAKILKVIYSIIMYQICIYLIHIY